MQLDLLGLDREEHVLAGCEVGDGIGGDVRGEV
jgi:hypothetical protein